MWMVPPASSRSVAWVWSSVELDALARLGEELELLIGLIAPPWLPVPPVRYGGIELVIDGLARGLVAAGHEVLLAAPAGSTCPVPQIAGLPARARQSGWDARSWRFHTR